MNLMSIRQALAAAVETVPSLRVVDHVPDQLPVGEEITAVAIIRPSAEYVDYHKAFAGNPVEVMLEVQVVVLRSDPRSAADELDELLSAGVDAPRSIASALMNDKTLGGVVADALPYRARNIGPVLAGPAGSPPYLGATIDVTVRTSR